MAAKREADVKHRGRIERLRSMDPLPPLRPTVDAYPYRQGFLIASDLPHTPRPVFQSYLAWSPELLRMNAQRLRGEDAPEWLLFNIETVDGRHPALDDSLSWLEILARYRFAGVTRTFAIFQRSAAPRAVMLTPHAGLNFAEGEVIRLPAVRRPLWARIDLRPTLLGRLAALFYKPPPVSIAIIHSGREERFRFVRGIGRGGFLISPLVRSAGDFILLNATGDGPRLPGVERVMLRYDRRFYQERGTIELEEVRVRPTQPPHDPSSE